MTDLRMERREDPVSVDDLRRLHRQMLRIRLVEERIAALYPEQRMRCPVHLSIGQEAVAAGAVTALGANDWVMSGHRSHGHYLAKGGDLRAMFAELYGKATGCTSGKGGSMHLLDREAGFMGAVPIVASTIPIAVGAAWGSRLRGEPRLLMSFFGDAAVEEGAFHEAMNFAALKQLPIVFVCENNLYSVFTPLELRQPLRPISDLAYGHGVPAASGDGNDPVEVLLLSRAAVERARAGGGPTLLVFDTYRYLEHCGPYDDDHLGYRPAGELAASREHDPLLTFERRLVAESILDADSLGNRRREIAAEIDGAVAFAEASPFPSAGDLATDVYATALG